MTHSSILQPLPKKFNPVRRPGFFQLHAPFSPQGDQEQAIKALREGVDRGERNQMLLGVTGSGKTFTMANLIALTQRPTLIVAPNKTLAAQLYGKMKEFFPSNAVEYFVSYYDYYRPEAYLPATDTYIEKEATINEKIEQMRHSATRSLLEREDVIVIASVSCIYGLGAIESYGGLAISFQQGQSLFLTSLLQQLCGLQYQRNDVEFKRGVFRVRGDQVDLFPAHYEDRAWRFSFFGSQLEALHEIDALTGKRLVSLEKITLYPNSHYVTPGPTLTQATVEIHKELEKRLAELKGKDRLVELQRLRERVTYDMESLRTTGMCSGIENYSCYFTGRTFGEPPPTLLEYLPKNALLMVDESHVAVPQIRGMSLGDAVRKNTLSEYGFRLPSCRHNRPLTFEEWDQMRPQTLFVSATPGPWELAQSGICVVEQLIRPTGLLEPVCSVHPCQGQIDHLRGELDKVIAEGGRVLITTLTKKMAEQLADYCKEAAFRAEYMHSDISTLERIQVISALRQGVFDILVGVNLLREGLDIPECQMVVILDADKEGLLRSKTALIQTMGRAARHVSGRVLLYADRISNALEQALAEIQRRRQIQHQHNERHGIIPRSVKALLPEKELSKSGLESVSNKVLAEKMLVAAKTLDFEKAEEIRKVLEKRGHRFR